MEAVLVIDMPDDCLLCPLCDYAVDWKGETTFYCRANEKDIDDTSEVAQWCPLRPLPLKGTMENVDECEYNRGYVDGRNHCIELITGETE